ncbi:hypothetical protein B0H17DRAFT_919505 [Mycena rosella]|uniref:Alpha/beta-hydrolase n=1 Tax=Mycena rosella TaxID=1033263 RepID=A0AAD7M928_MYCRO|nr:hypothetical protein B0H17DRAFT_919505 [Mycena rosella]
MQSIVSRPQPLASSPSARVPRKSTSFMSLRREKTKPSPVPAPYDPSPAHTTYFDAYPRPPPTRSSKTRPRDPTPSSPTRRTSPPSPAAEGPSVAFPTLEFPPGGAYSVSDVPTPLQRSRSYTGPSGRSLERYTWTELGAVPDLRFSGSSTQHTETPPDTPVDSIDGGSFADFAVVVSALVSGVETMDALVDGMNHGEDILGRDISSSSHQRFGVPGHHPLYEPPLPTPPPGVILGGPKHRRQKRESYSSNSESEGEEARRQALEASRPRRRRTRPSPTRNASSNSTITPAVLETPVEKEVSFPTLSSVETTPRKSGYVTHDKQRAVAPSISDIIRSHAPQGQVRPRPSIITRSAVYAHSHGHSTVHEESEPEPVALDDEADIVSRSSVDSIADEVRRTMRNQSVLKPAPTLPPPSSFLKRHSTFSDNASLYSPRSDGGAGSSLYAPSITSNHQPTSPIDLNFLSFTRPSPSQAVAQYLRSARLTTLLKLTRSPHASQDNPLTVSLSDLGNPTGFPVLVFLGLGCVRHVMGLYDDMAQCLGLRLITIDRWGLGRTAARAKTSKGIMQWASVAEEVLDLLQISECSVMAHSAGTPYALSFANKLPDRIRGNICLLAPWVGGSENGGYKWLKYVPNGILKTAQAAEWKVQAWMIGKPPTIAYEGIGYTATRASPKLSTQSGNRTLGSVDTLPEGRRRPSIGSTFSEYDDLQDFDGRFESRSTLGMGVNGASPQPRSDSKTPKRKPSRSFLGRLKGSQPPSPTEETKPAPVLQTGRKLKALRSMGSLKGKASSYPTPKRSEPSSPRLPPAPKLEMGLGFDDMNWVKSGGSSQTSLIPETSKDSRSVSERFYTTPSRAEGRRSMSFTSAPTWSPQSMPSSPAASSYNTSSTSVFAPSSSSAPGSEYQSSLGNALIAASHAESAKGMHNDLLQILNHDNHPWGFSYSHYPHEVNVWYGDKDEKIAENAVRWMEKNMGEDRCSVKVVKGADHALMYNSSVVVEVLEQVLGYWQPGEPSFSF